MPHHLITHGIAFGSGAAFLTALITLLKGAPKLLEILANTKSILPWAARNGNHKLTKSEHDSMCLRHLDPIFKATTQITTDIALHSQRLQQDDENMKEIRGSLDMIINAMINNGHKLKG